MPILEEILAAGMSGYALFGSISIGYILLRAGWPGMDKLAQEYRIGSALIIGSAFAVLAIAAAYSYGFLSQSGASTASLFIILLPLVLVVSVLFMFAKRMLPGRKPAVSKPTEIPKEVEGAKKVFDFAMDKLNLSSGFVKVEKWDEERRSQAIAALESKERVWDVDKQESAEEKTEEMEVLEEKEKPGEVEVEAEKEKPVEPKVEAEPVAEEKEVLEVKEEAKPKEFTPEKKEPHGFETPEFDLPKEKTETAIIEKKQTPKTKKKKAEKLEKLEEAESEIEKLKKLMEEEE